jgi:hypothetical protein
MRYCILNDMPADGPMAVLLEDIFLHGIARAESPAASEGEPA